jgi:hypothetical protein
LLGLFFLVVEMAAIIVMREASLTLQLLHREFVQ